MPRKKLQHPEDEPLQNLEVNAGASIEAQPHAEIELTAPAEIPTEEPKAKVKRTKRVKQVEQTEPVEPVEQVEQTEPVESVEQTEQVEQVEQTEPVEPVEQVEQVDEVSEIYATIEDTQNKSKENQEEEEEEEEEEKEPESVEDIEKEYLNLSLEQLVEKLQEVVSNDNINNIKQRVGVLKTAILVEIKQLKKDALEKFIEEGGVKEEYEYVPDELEIQFNDALKKYKDNKTKFLENLEIEKQQNFESKQQIIQGLKELVENENNLKILNDKFKEFQEKWREIGPVPQNESSNLWQHYHFYVEKFFDILRINKELRTLDLKKNLEQKVRLCEQAEELLLQDSISKSFKALQHLHEEWREIGPVPEDKKEEIWERFKNASDQLNQRRRAHYDSLLEEQQNNYNAKVVICEQAEELVSLDSKTLKDSNNVSEKLTELLKVWKTLGPAPAKLNEEIWQRFKIALDKFFTSKKEYLQQLKNEQLQNYNQKLTLAIQAEALSLRTDWKKATDEIISLQNEWKRIGPTARKNSDVVWKRFRRACDKFFETKSSYFNNAQTIESENLLKKEELIKKIEEHEFTDNKEENLEVMKAYQREFMDLGHVPRKDKDKIYNKFREVVNKRFEDLKMTMEDVKRSNFKSKIETILNNPDADKILDKERRFLTNKLQQLKEDIALWENNLGFFANSKNADLLKAEFAKKIEAAKTEVKELEYKIKVMVHKK
ncbi:MAG: DUF349 domain-containing protein [Bacteroidales bacterium]|jgi:hypothetical protein|nr:DUF349 domain-containing protein [Bacteroidales bacterium]